MFLYAKRWEREREKLAEGKDKNKKKKRGSSHFLEKCPVIRERSKKREGNVFNV